MSNSYAAGSALICCSGNHARPETSQSMVSRDWAIQRFHECIVGWPCRCGPARNLGLRAIRLMTAPICSGQPSGIRPNPKAAVSAMPVAIAIAVKYPMRSAAIVISSITLPQFGTMPQKQAKSCALRHTRDCGRNGIIPGPCVAAHSATHHQSVRAQRSPVFPTGRGG
jgi:hypothetical protein